METRLKLPDVTLVMVETREHELARLAVEDCLRLVEFGDVLVLTDKPKRFGTLRQQARFHEVQDWPDKLGWSRAWWFEVPALLLTRQTLNIQWDSGIWDVGMWRDEYLEYDYIGAPWWYKDGKNVGNGGFSLVSSALKRYVSKHRAKFPCTTSVDDDLLCRKYRPELEAVGFKWAPEDVARDFSFEGCDGAKPSRHFGYHAMFNWTRVFDEAALAPRLALAKASPYIAKSYMLKSFYEAQPHLVKEVAESKGVR